MKFNIETLKKKKHLYGIYLDSKNPKIIDFLILQININSIYWYKKFTFELSVINNNIDTFWFTTIYEHVINDEINHSINVPFISLLSNKKEWDSNNYLMYNFLFCFNKTTLKKKFKEIIEEKNNEIKIKINELNNDINSNNDKIKKIKKK